MLKILLMIAAIATLFCLCVIMVCLFAAFSGNELPDIEDV
jgi:hypothetical protein